MRQAFDSSPTLVGSMLASLTFTARRNTFSVVLISSVAGEVPCASTLLTVISIPSCTPKLRNRVASFLFTSLYQHCVKEIRPRSAVSLAVSAAPALHLSAEWLSLYLGLSSRRRFEQISGHPSACYRSTSLGGLESGPVSLVLMSSCALIRVRCT